MVTGPNMSIDGPANTSYIDIDHGEAEEVGRKLEAMSGKLKNYVQGGNGSAYGLQHWHDLLGDVLVLDGDLRGITGGIQSGIKMVIDDMLEASRVAEECGKGLRKMSEFIKNAKAE